MIWQVQEAKQRFSELIRRAREEGPQMVTYRGEEAAVVLSAKEYHELTARKPSFKEHLLASPDWDGLEDLFERPREYPRDYPRDIEL
jgi:prevent-host-death family protein